MDYDHLRSLSANPELFIVAYQKQNSPLVPQNSLSNTDSQQSWFLVWHQYVQYIVITGSTYLMEAQSAGNYQAAVNLDASPDPSCDPTQDICENWLPGNYSVTFS